MISTTTFVNDIDNNNNAIGPENFDAKNYTIDTSGKYSKICFIGNCKNTEVSPENLRWLVVI